MLALPAFVRLEWKRYTRGTSRWALKQDIIQLRKSYENLNHQAKSGVTAGP